MLSAYRKLVIAACLVARSGLATEEVASRSRPIVYGRDDREELLRSSRASA